MDKKIIWIVAAIVFGIFAAGTALALMPPHVSKTIPDNNGLLTGDTIILHGYTLDFTQTEDLQVTDVTTGQPAPIRRDVQCQWEGKGDCPGCRQQACTITIKLLAPVPGHTYQFIFLDQTYRFTMAPKPDSKP